MGLASDCSVHSSCLSGGFHLPSLVAVLCSAVAVSQRCPGCLRDTSGGLSLCNTSSSTGDLISSWCSDYEQPGKPPAIDYPEVPSLHHVEVRVVAGLIIVIVDRFTKYLIVVLFKKTHTAEQLGHLLLDRLVRDHRVQIMIITDRDKLFTSNYWKTISAAMGTKLKMSMVYHPQTDSQTE